MLALYVPRGSTLERVALPASAVPDEVVWVDLVSPTPEDDRLVGTLLGVAVPTREEMQEIEVSSRLYIENGARYMTAALMCRSETDSPKITPVTFILAPPRLVTVRYEDPRPFSLITAKLARHCPQPVTGEAVLLDLLYSIIDRDADIL
jgi:magnesium transporter